MNLDRRGLIAIGILGIILLLNLFNGNITGNVVIVSVNDVNNCSNDTIKNIWDGFFNEDSDGVKIFRNNYVDGNCDSYFVIKTNENGELRYLNKDVNDFSGVDITVFYANVTDDIMSDILEINSYDDDLIMDEIYIQNWSVENSTVAKEKFDDYFKIDSSRYLLSYDSGYYDFVLSYEEDFLIENIEGYIAENKSFISFIYSHFNFTNNHPLAILTNNISNYTFGINSSWNYAFDVNDYFNYSNVKFDLETFGSSVDSLINESGVFFKPKIEFNGSKEFNIRAYIQISESERKIYNRSNLFNITIETMNDAPVFIKSFGSVGISENGSFDLLLDLYFEDPDEDNLTYRVIGDEDLTINISNNIMIISPKENFDYTKLRIYASDGISETRSNYFYVYNTQDPNNEILLESLFNESLEDINISSDILPLDNTSENKSGSINDGNGIDWVLWGFVLVIVLISILFSIWFFILRKNKFRNSFDNGSLENLQNNNLKNDPVKNYLDGLNLSK